MADISETYASPNLRWALLLEDHPGSSYTFRSAEGVEVGLPEGWGAENEHCVCTITFPASSQLEPVVAWKDVTEELSVERWEGNNPRRKVKVELPRTSDLWASICTKTLGRALKRAGYPDDMQELKAAMLWRRRRAEVLAVMAGTAGALAPADDRALDAAGRPDEAAAVADRDSAIEVTEAPVEVSGAATMATVAAEDPGLERRVELVRADVGAAADDLADLVEQCRRAMGKLTSAQQATARDRLRPLQITPGSPKTPDEAITHLAIVFGIDGSMDDTEPDFAGGYDS